MEASIAGSVIMTPTEWKGLASPKLTAKRLSVTKCHGGKCELSSTHSEGEVHEHFVRRHGSRKNVFAVHGVNEPGQPELVRPSMARARLHELIASLSPYVIVLEACSGAHHWARLFTAHGHAVRLMAPKFVVPYRRRASEARTMRPTPQRSVKRCSDRTCASCR